MKTEARPGSNRAWEALQPKVREVLALEGVDEAGVEGSLLRIAAYLHIRNGEDLDTFLLVARRHFETTQKKVENV